MNHKLRTIFGWTFAMVAVAVTISYPLRAHGLGALVRITKQNQAENGLKFNLVATRLSSEVVMVRMEIPKEGKLKVMRAVRLSLGSGNGSPELSAPLKTEEGKNGAWTIEFQLSSALSEKCFIDMNVPMNVGYTIYSVVVKDYVVDQK